MAIFLVNASLSSWSFVTGGGRAGKRGDIAVKAGTAVSGDTGDRGSSTSTFISVNRCMNHFCEHTLIFPPDFATRSWTDKTEIQVSETLQVLRRDQVLFRHGVCREEVQLNPSLLPTDLPIH